MARTIPYNDHREFNDPSTWVALFEIEMDQWYYLTPMPTAPITADGNVYDPFPIMLNEIRQDSSGSVQTVQLTCSNITGAMASALRTLKYAVDGKEVIFKQYSIEKEVVVYEEHLEIIQVGAITRESFILELGTFNPFLAQLLQDKFMRDFCWNRYKGTGCWIAKSNGTYGAPSTFTVGDSDTCTYRLDNCRLHNNILRFNSFPGIPGSTGFV